MTLRKTCNVAIFLGILALFTTSCVQQPTAPKLPVRQNLSIYGFSIQEEVVTKEIMPAFQAYWKQQADEEVIFTSVFTGSEHVAAAILGGGTADVAILSNEQHATWLHINDYAVTDWRAFPQGGVFSRSPIVIVVRPGNPLRIRDWADVARPGVQVIHPDPRTSGGAQWAVLAEYGAALLGSGDKQAAQAQLASIWANVIATPPSAREALKHFLFGEGDVLITYEQDALLAKSRGAAIEVVMPPSTIMSEHVVVLVDRNVESWEQKAAQEFVNFLWSKTAQKALTRYYFRATADESLNQATPEFLPIERPFTVEDLGGWGRAYPEIINQIWMEQIAAQ